MKRGTDLSSEQDHAAVAPFARERASALVGYYFMCKLSGMRCKPDSLSLKVQGGQRRKSVTSGLMGKVSESYVTELSQAVPNEAANPLLEKHEDAVSEPAAVRLWLRLLTCSLTIEKRVRRRLADEFETTLPRFDVLAALDRNPDGMTMGDLSQALLVSGGNLTALVRQLQRQGFLTMARDPLDRRSWLVSITDSGRTHFTQVAAEHHHWIAEVFAGMSADHSERLYELLAELKESLAMSARDRR